MSGTVLSLPSLIVDEDDDDDQTIKVPDHLNDSQLSLLTDKNFDHSIQSEPSLSLHPSSDSEVEEDKPEAVFEVREHVVKTGSQKGKIQKIVSLSIGNHTFKRRRKMGNGNQIFTVCKSGVLQSLTRVSISRNSRREIHSWFLLSS